MEYVSYSLLRKIVKDREVNLSEISKCLSKQFGDHRDFYPLATLYTAGYIGSTFKADNDPDFDSSLYMAAMFYTACMGPGRQNYMMFTFFNSEDGRSREKFYATAKADMYFAELRQKRIDRVVTLLSSVAVGVLSALLTLVVKSTLAL